MNLTQIAKKTTRKHALELTQSKIQDIGHSADTDDSYKS